MSAPLKLATVVGNPRPGSRTTTIAAEVAAQVAATLGGTVLPLIDLAEHGPAVLDPDAEAVADDVRIVAQADVLVVASPTYKATYTGLLKVFFDRYRGSELRGVVAIGVMVGGSAHHALAGEVHLRPLLVELGAVVPARTLYVVDSELDVLDETVRAWLEESGPTLRRATGRA